MDAINQIAAEHGIWVVEDAACGFGVVIMGLAGTLGNTDAPAFTLAMSWGEGGITTNDGQSQKRLDDGDHGAAMSDLQRHLGQDRTCWLTTRCRL